MILNDSTRERFDREVAKYPPEHRQSAVMACLAIVQQEQGHVSREAEDMIAAYLRCALRRSERYEDSDVRSYLRTQQQLRRLPLRALEALGRR